MNKTMSETKENQLKNHTNDTGQKKNSRKRTILFLIPVAVIAIAAGLLY
jgi:hypothetical protein